MQGSYVLCLLSSQMSNLQHTSTTSASGASSTMCTLLRISMNCDRCMADGPTRQAIMTGWQPSLIEWESGLTDMHVQDSLLRRLPLGKTSHQLSARPISAKGNRE